MREAMRCLGLRGIWPVAMLAALSATPAHAWWFDPPPPPEPPPVHVYDYSRGPTWTPNGWAYVPREVQFPRAQPPVVVPPQNLDPALPIAAPVPPPGVDLRPPLPSMKDLGVPTMPSANKRKAKLK